MQDFGYQATSELVELQEVFLLMAQILQKPLGLLPVLGLQLLEVGAVSEKQLQEEGVAIAQDLLGSPLLLRD